MAVGDRVVCVDKKGCPFEVVECGEQDSAALIDMYDAFYPLAESQGLPPANALERRKWIDKLLKTARNFIAIEDEKAVGHSALIPDMDKLDAEYIIFVTQDFRNRGLGGALTGAALRRAAELGLTRIWLTVESYNFRAIKLYRKSGFVFVDQGERERTMILDM